MAELTAALGLEAAGVGGGLYTDGILGNFKTRQVAKHNYSQRTGCLVPQLIVISQEGQVVLHSDRPASGLMS